MGRAFVVAVAVVYYVKQGCALEWECYNGRVGASPFSH